MIKISQYILDHIISLYFTDSPFLQREIARKLNISYNIVRYWIETHGRLYQEFLLQFVEVALLKYRKNNVVKINDSLCDQKREDPCVPTTEAKSKNQMENV